MDKASHLTDLSISGEEDRSAILLAHFIFLVLIEDKVIKRRWLGTCQKLAEGEGGGNRGRVSTF